MKGALTVTLNASGETAQSLEVTARSEAEPGGETLTLKQVSPGVYSGDLVLERIFDEQGKPLAKPGSGKLAVYAEGGKQSDTITVLFGQFSATASFLEPPSTVTGIVSLGGVAVGGAQVELAGSDGSARRTSSRSDGSYAFHDVPHGTYVLVVAKNGGVQKTLSVSVP